MLRIRRKGEAGTTTGCPHHFHADETGWRCCACPHHVGAGTDRPESTGTCAEATCPAPADSPRHWLAPAAPGTPRPTGSRPGRRRPHRSGDR